MKLLKVIILATFLVSIMPLAAFCHDTHQDTMAGHGHCVMMCSSVCFHATIPDQKIVSISATPVVSVMLAVIDSAYQNPSLDTLKRPPVFSA